MDEMDSINQLDLITQRVLSLHIKNVETQMKTERSMLEAALRRIAELESPPPVEASEGA